jgi:dihydropteroate synthase
MRHLRRDTLAFGEKRMIQRAKFRLRMPSRTIVLGERTLIMGVLNVTPDSFSDGVTFLDTEAAVAHALEMERAGADILDIGGESTRPGSKRISSEEQLRRISPVLKILGRELKIPISVDTRNAAVAKAAIDLGAEMVNDVSALRADPDMAAITRDRHMPIILMHMRGEPGSMQKGRFARDVMRDVVKGLRDAVLRATRAGIDRSQILLDPGIGFGKNFQQNFEILARLPELAKLGRPIVVGASRKGFIGAALGGVPSEQRGWGTAATVAASILGGAHIVRVHDVDEMAQVAKVTDRILKARG